MFDVPLINDFWQFPACSKYDVLDDRDRRQSRMIYNALLDKHTKIEEVSPKSFIVFSDAEALLIETHRPHNILLLLFCKEILKDTPSLA